MTVRYSCNVHGYQQPATGKTLAAALEAELSRLQPAPDHPSAILCQFNGNGSSVQELPLGRLGTWNQQNW
jgi:hypothetical protein